MTLKHLILGGLIATASLSGYANPVIVKMNAVSTTMTLVEKESGESVEIPEPENKQYSLDLNPGQYVLSGYATDGKTLNGTIVLNVTDSTTTQQFTVLTCTAYVSNKTDGGTSWSVENGDYTLNVKINTREGVEILQTTGNSTTANRYTFLALNGNSYNVAFEPSDEHKSEGYMTLYRGGTLTANVNVTGAIPTGGDYSITIPSEAELQLGMKFTHFTDFTPVEPTSMVTSNEGKTYNYVLANGQVYNYRTWKQGGLTHGGYFTMNTSAPEKCPKIGFTDSDYAEHDPKAINHSVQSNNGYETGDLLLNINPSHHLKLKQGEEFLVHAMRMWEISDNSTNNYFFEPDFHYTVLNTDFQPSKSVIEIENCLENNTSSWSKIKAKEAGTAIVLVTYDGINLNYYNNADRKDYLGGSYWGAIWPENTGVFVVTVGDGESSVVPNMTVNEEYNMDALRLAGKYVDAEHDVFYYLDTEAGYYFSFTPEGIASIDIAYPEISETDAKYTAFTTDGIVKNEDGSYTVFLKEGRNIIRMTDAAGQSVYQVLRAKPCHRVITNETRPGSAIFQPGDKVKIQYSGLFHPANKIAGIYNMSAYVTYNYIPNGSSLILGSGQYTFGSAPSAQAVTVDIPVDYDVTENPEWVMDKGVIQVNGYGDPIGNHRNTSPTAGRSPNFTAVPHKTYFGSIPDIRIALNPVKYFDITLSGVPEKAEVVLSFNGTEISPDENGLYSGTYGNYAIVAKAEGYKCYRHDYTIGDDCEGSVVFPVEMQLLGDAWDGKTLTQPATDEDGIYLISNGAELAWFAENVNENGATQNAALLNDIELGNFDWTPIGNSSKTFYSGTFDGQGHTISEIYINDDNNYKGLFGSVQNSHIKGVTVKGCVTGKQYVGGLAGYVKDSSIDRCANYCTVTGSKTYVGGLVGQFYSDSEALTNCYNAGAVWGTTNCGGVIGDNKADAVMSNIFNVGAVSGTKVGACVGGTSQKSNLFNAFSIFEYSITDNQSLVTAEQMASGEIAYKLGDAFFQTLGQDTYPVFDGLKVYYDEEAHEFYNMATGFTVELGEGNDDVEIIDGKVVMHVRDEYQLEVVACPLGARLPEILWATDNEEVASVDGEGLVYAVGKGETTIEASATVDDEQVTASCSVNVIGAVATELVIEQKEVALNIKDNPTAVVSAKHGPDYADEPRVTWSTSDEKVVTIENDGTLSATLKAVGTGDAVVTVAHADNPDVFDTCIVHVTGESSLIETIFAADNVEEADIFDTAGRIIKLKATQKFFNTLAPGIYIIKYGNTTKEIIIK